MPIIMRDWLVPSSAYQPYLLEDTFMRGGFRIVETLADRDNRIHPLAMKEGMMVYVEEEKQYYTLDEFNLNSMTIVWGKAKFGGPIEQVAAPLFVDQGVLKMSDSNIIPSDGVPGQRITVNAEGKLVWVDDESGATRAKIDFTCPVSLNPQESYDFTLDLGKSVLLIQVALNAPEVELTAYPTSTRSEENPYKFVSDVDFPYDQGIRKEDGEQLKFRRYAFLVNQEDPVGIKHFFRFKNISANAVMPKVEIYYLRLE